MRLEQGGEKQGMDKVRIEIGQIKEFAKTSKPIEVAGSYGNTWVLMLVYFLESDLAK